MSEPAGRLAGKTAVVLGGSGPHGAAAARLLGREGANVALGGRDRERLEGLEAEIHADGGQALVVGTHLAKRHHPAHLAGAALEAFGSLDVLLFAAHAPAPPLASLDADAWEASVDVNLKGFVYCMAAALPAMREREGGHVVVLNVRDPRPDPLSLASRAAVQVLLAQLAREFAPEGIAAATIEGDARRENDPERCAEALIRALAEPPDPNGKPRTYPA